MSVGRNSPNSILKRSFVDSAISLNRIAQTCDLGQPRSLNIVFIISPRADILVGQLRMQLQMTNCNALAAARQAFLDRHHSPTKADPLIERVQVLSENFGVDAAQMLHHQHRSCLDA